MSLNNLLLKMSRLRPRGVNLHAQRLGSDRTITTVLGS